MLLNCEELCHGKLNDPLNKNEDMLALFICMFPMTFSTKNVTLSKDPTFNFTIISEKVHRKCMYT